MKLQQDEAIALEYIFTAVFKDDLTRHGCGIPTQDTIRVMETVLENVEKCNKNLSELITRTLGTALRARGWLVRILKQLGRELSFKFRTCTLFVAGYGYKSQIIESMYHC